MNINRHNYEEYFLLYADKELSVEERNMVEMFVQQNPDLEEEFIMLQQSVVKPDNTIKLKDKSFLLREEFISENNYEEKFLLYTDNELNLFEVEETEKFVLSNPSLQNEFTLLQQVKYAPDTSIVFPDKRSLYKKEDTGKIIPFRWKALAAAVLIGIGLWIGVSYLLQKNKTERVIVKQTTVPVKKNIIQQVKKKDDDKNLVKNEDQNTSLPKQIKTVKNNSIQKQSSQDVTVKNIQPENKKPEVNKIPGNKNEDVAVTNVQKEELIKTTFSQPNNTTSEPNAKTVISSAEVKTNNYSQPASYITEAEGKSENYIFYNVTQEQFQKSKIGIFFKKVKRAIERKNPLKNTFKGTAEIAKDEN